MLGQGHVPVLGAVTVAMAAEVQLAAQPQPETAGDRHRLDEGAVVIDVDTFTGSVPHPSDVMPKSLLDRWALGADDRAGAGTLHRPPELGARGARLQGEAKTRWRP